MTVSDLVADAPIERDGDESTTDDGGELRPSPRPSRLRRVAMRPRRVIVKLHRWLALGLFAWLIIVSFTGAWLVVHDSIESVLHSDRFRSTSGDVGPQAAFEAAQASLPAEATVYGLTTPRNGRGVYQVYAELYPPTIDDEVTTTSEHRPARVPHGVRRPGNGRGERRPRRGGRLLVVALPGAHVPLAGLRPVRRVRSRRRMVSQGRRWWRAGRCPRASCAT